MIEITRFLNTSLVVDNLNSTLDDYTTIFGLSVARRMIVAEMACDAAILAVPGSGDRVYALEAVGVIPTPEDGGVRGSEALNQADAEQALRRFLKDRGEGVYRLAFEVADFDAALSFVKERDLSHIYYRIALNDYDGRVLILSPKHTYGAMFEFLPTGDYKTPALGDSHGAEGRVLRRYVNAACLVRDLSQAIGTYRDLFGLEPTRQFADPETRARCATFTIDGDEVIELRERTGDAQAAEGNAAFAGRAKKSLGKRGEGIARLTFEVNNYEDVLSRLDESGVDYTQLTSERVCVVNPQGKAHGVTFVLRALD
jgi:catechol 2,3-dioxygenase-like lactoylglutathione lyase family enzyme